MGNYCNGEITCTGPSGVLSQVYNLCERLDELASITGFDADSDWLGHIFKQEYISEGIFCEGADLESDDKLVVYIRASRTDGDDYFKAMATGLGINIHWRYVADYDNREYKVDCKPNPKGPKWELRDLSELDDDEDDGDEEDAPPRTGGVYSPWDYREGSGHSIPASGGFAGGSFGVVDRMSLFGSTSAGARPGMPVGSTGVGSMSQSRAGTGAFDARTCVNKIYQHYWMACTLIQQSERLKVDSLVVTRIIADAFICGSTAMQLSAHISSAIPATKFDAADGALSEISGYVRTLYPVFMTPAPELKYSSVNTSLPQYDIIHGLLSDCYKLLTLVELPGLSEFKKVQLGTQVLWYGY